MFDSSGCEGTQSEALQTDFGSDAQSSCDQLKEENANLIKQNSLLKAQFDTAVSLASKTEELSKENVSLKNLVVDLKSEKEDLLNRLEIANKAQKEAIKKLEEQKKHYEQMRANELFEIQKEMNLTKNSWQTTQNELNKQIQDLEEKLNSYQISEEIMKQKMQKLILNVNHYLSINLTEFTDLFEFFDSQQPLNPPIQPSAKIDFRDDEIVKKLRNKNKKIKAVLLTMQKNAEFLEDQQRNKQIQFDKREKELQAEISRLKDIYLNKEDEYKLEIEELKGQNSILEAKIKVLQEKASKTPQRPAPQIVIQSPVKQIEKSESKEKSEKPKCKAIINGLKEQIKKLLTQQKASNSKISELTHKIDENDQNIINLSSQITKLQSDNQTKSKLLDESEQQLKILRNNFSNSEKNYKDVIKTQELQIKKQQQSISTLEKTKEVLRKEIVENQIKITDLEQNSQKLSREVDQKTDQIEELNYQVKNLNENLIDCKLELQKPEITEADIVPPSSWKISHFDKELQDKLNVIIGNPSLKAGSKIQAVLSAIPDYYSGVINQIDDEMQKINFHNNQRFTILNDFVVSLAIVLSGTSVTIEDIISGKGNEIISKIKDSQEKIAALCRENSDLQQKIGTICSSFGGRFDTVEDAAAFASSALVRCEAKIERLSKRKKSLAKALSACEDRNKEMEQELSRLRLEAETAKEEREKLSKAAETLKTENSSLRKKVSAAERAGIEAEQRYNADLDSKYDEYAEKIREVEELRLAENSKHEEEIANLRNELKAAKDKISELSLRQKNSDTQSSLQIEMHKEELNREKTKLAKEVDRLKGEKSALQDGFESSISEFQKKLTSSVSEINDLSTLCSELQQKLSKSNEMLAQAEEKNDSLTKRLKVMEEEIGREKQLLHAAAVAKEQECESKINDIAGKEKLKIESEKRKIFSIAATTLSNLFETTSKLDERSFKTLMSKAKESIEKLSNSDTAVRRLVNASPGQLTEDAVAKFVYKVD